MSPSPLYAPPADRAVIIVHEKRLDGPGQIAIIAPTPEPGISFVGIIETHGGWRFIKGPAKVKSGRVWLWLYKQDPNWPLFTTHIRSKDCLSSKLCDSLDDFIDLLCSEDVEESPANVAPCEPAKSEGSLRALFGLALSVVVAVCGIIASGDLLAFWKAQRALSKVKSKRERGAL